MFIGKVVKIRVFVFNQMPLKLLSVGSPSWCWLGEFCGVSHSMWYMRGSSHWWSYRSCFRDILLPLLTLMLPIQSRVITITSALLWYLYFLGASIKGLGQYRYFSCIVMYSGPDSVPIHWLWFLCLRGVLIGRHHYGNSWYSLSTCPSLSMSQWRGIQQKCSWVHYDDVIMGAMASQITSLTIVCSTVYSDADQTKYQSSASMAFVRGIHRGPVNSPHKWPVTRKMFPLMTSSCLSHLVATWGSCCGERWVVRFLPAQWSPGS